MRVVTSATVMQRLALDWRRRGIAVCLVPTMGYLHEGHLSLVRSARRAAGKRGVVVVSIYVNPTQFGAGDDFTKSPRDLVRDRKLCRASGVDLLFLPNDRQMYPAPPGAQFSTYVAEGKLSRGMAGASRRGHCRGVTPVLTKLFNLVLPEVAVFGAKDFQQAAIVRRMVRDLNFPVRLIVAPTVRETDGLALSSRNKYLSGTERRQAVVLWQAIRQARRAVRRPGPPVAASRLKAELKWLIETRPAARVDYIEFFDARSLEPAASVRRGLRMALAVFVGKTRLIDNGSV